jgi:hypothetical protein
MNFTLTKTIVVEAGKYFTLTKILAEKVKFSNQNINTPEQRYWVSVFVRKDIKAAHQ